MTFFDPLQLQHRLIIQRNINGIGVISEAATGSSVAKSLSGGLSAKRISMMDIPVFWTPVSMAMAIWSAFSKLKITANTNPIRKPTQTLRPAEIKIRQVNSLTIDQ